MDYEMDSFLLRPHKMGKTDQVQQIIESMTEQLWSEMDGESTRIHKVKWKRKEMLKQVIANLLEASWRKMTLGIPMDHYAYGKRSWLSFCNAPYKAMMFAVENLVKLDYVTKQTGHLGRVSTFTPTDKFTGLIPTCKSEPLVFDHKSHPLVYLTDKIPVLDASGNHIKDKKGLPKYKKEYISLSDTLQEETGKNLLERYNKLLRDSTVTYKPNSTTTTPSANNTTTNYTINTTAYKSPLPYTTTGQNSEVENSEVGGIIVRIFQRGDENCQSGGRLYGKGFDNHQSLLKEERATIQINGENTVELDWKAFHLFMTYASHDIQYPMDGDPYLLDEDQIDLRPLTKSMLLTALNCPGRKSCLLSIHKESREIREAAIKGTAKPKQLSWLKLYDRYRDDLKELYDELIEKHTPIADWIGSDKGILLQNMDSFIMMDILSHFTDKGILVLPVHDSCIIAEHHAEELRRIMNETYKRHMNGHTCPIEVK